MDFLKGAAGKVIAGLVSAATLMIVISWWRTDPASRQQLLDGAGRIFSWLLVVLVVPWASFFLIGRVARLESNLAGGVLVTAYTAGEATGLAWLFGWTVHGSTAWAFFSGAVLLAGVYNLFACDWIAEKAA